MPFVDTATGKIVGCKKNSPTWWHEKGHIAFSKLEKGIRYNYYQDFLFKVAIFFITLTLFFPVLLLKVYSGLLVVMAFYYFFYEEAWCWKYALDRKDKWVR